MCVCSWGLIRKTYLHPLGDDIISPSPLQEDNSRRVPGGQKFDSNKTPHFQSRLISKALKSSTNQNGQISSAITCVPWFMDSKGLDRHVIKIVHGW